MCSTQSVQVLVQLFDHGECDVPVLTEVPIRPQPGFRYFYEWTDWDKKSDWRVDGYSWRQNGRYKFAYKDVECDKIYFKLRVGECDVFTNEFSRTVIINPLVPNRVLVIYEGDNSVVVDLPHGNAKHPSKKSKPFYRTRPSLINAMKNLKNKLPVQIYSNLTLAAPKALDRHIVDAPRNIEQVRNARKFIPKEIRLTKKAINNLADLYYETEFIQHFQLFPNLKLICFLQTAVNNFKSLLLDESLSAQCLSYNTTLECGHFYLSVLAYQQTEFQESPDVPLLFMIHDKKFKSEQDFLFQQLTILIPELKNSQKTILITDKETAIVNAAKRHLPHIPRFRCWIHALKSIKSKLRSFGITDKQQLKEYKDDFISLLNQETLADYQSLLVEYMMKWNQNFAVYYRDNIDVDIHQMGSWCLKPYGLRITAAHNQSQSLHAIIKQFNGWREPIDVMVTSLLRIAQLFERRVIQAQHQIGREWNLKSHLHSKYVILSQPAMNDEDHNS